MLSLASNSGRLHRSVSQLRNCPATWQLIRILIMVQAIPFIWDLTQQTVKLEQSQHLFGLSLDQLLSGNIWQPISYALIHGNWPHLALNTAAILIFGSKLEHIFTKRPLWLLALYSTITGAAFFLISQTFTTSPPQTLVGSSAICFAFLVFLTTLSPQSRFLPLFLSGRSIGLAILITSLAFALLDPALPFSPLAKSSIEIFPGEVFQISHACHFGGALAGWLYARYILRPRITLQSLQKARAKSEKSSPQNLHP